jgi:hypothetical protein
LISVGFPSAFRALWQEQVGRMVMLRPTRPTRSRDNLCAIRLEVMGVFQAGGGAPGRRPHSPLPQNRPARSALTKWYSRAAESGGERGPENGGTAIGLREVVA